VGVDRTPLDQAGRACGSTWLTGAVEPLTGNPGDGPGALPPICALALTMAVTLRGRGSARGPAVEQRRRPVARRPGSWSAGSPRTPRQAGALEQVPVLEVGGRRLPLAVRLGPIARSSTAYPDARLRRHPARRLRRGLSFLSPCVLPLVPAYIGQLRSSPSSAGTRDPVALAHAVRHAIAPLLGSRPSSISASPRPRGRPSRLPAGLRMIGGVLLIVMSLNLAGILRILRSTAVASARGQRGRRARHRHGRVRDARHGKRAALGDRWAGALGGQGEIMACSASASSSPSAGRRCIILGSISPLRHRARRSGRAPVARAGPQGSVHPPGSRRPGAGAGAPAGAPRTRGQLRRRDPVALIGVFTPWTGSAGSRAWPRDLAPRDPSPTDPPETRRSIVGRSPAGSLRPLVVVLRPSPRRGDPARRRHAVPPTQPPRSTWSLGRRRATRGDLAQDKEIVGRDGNPTPWSTSSRAVLADLRGQPVWIFCQLVPALPGETPDPRNRRGVPRAWRSSGSASGGDRG
jgi:hypothetical protein